MRRAIADIAVTRGGGAGEVFEGALRSMASSGQTSTRNTSVRQLARMGLRQTDVYASIARQLGITGRTERETGQRVAAAIKHGSVTGAVGTAALLDVVGRRVDRGGFDKMGAS